jgi:hypothetical protein
MDIEYRTVDLPKTKENIKLISEYDQDIVDFYDDENHISLTVEIRTEWKNDVFESDEIRYFDPSGQEYSEEISEVIFNAY